MRYVTGLAVASAFLAGCGGRRFPEPTYGAQVLPPDAWVDDLEQPPPAVQSEEIGPSPGKGYVWIDGQWLYQPLTKRWTWEQGAWCVPPPGAAYYAQPVVERHRKATGRVARWNEALQRYEEVDSGDDVYRWARGRFYVKEANGVVHPAAERASCVAATGKGEAPAK